MYMVVIFCQGVLGAALHTKATLWKAAIGLEHELRFRADPFRIVAPPAAQGAAFEEQGGPDPGTIMNGIMFDVEEST